ncbi:hypothetical protein NT017_18340 [Prolixibacter sp. NT017]|nr:hypothetical protein NT017_18340 [Prolixibacter sp. NT017]
MNQGKIVIHGTNDKKRLYEESVCKNSLRTATGSSEWLIISKTDPVVYIMDGQSYEINQIECKQSQ